MECNGMLFEECGLLKYCCTPVFALATKHAIAVTVLERVRNNLVGGTTLFKVQLEWMFFFLKKNS